MEEIDVFICCASFEMRSRSLADNILQNNIKKVLVANNINLNTYVGENLKYLMERFGKRAIAVPIDSGDAIKTADELNNALEAVFKEQYHNYLIDITTFTHESLLMLLKLLCKYRRNEDIITLAYTSATNYSLDENKPEKKWLSKGISDIRSVLGYPGEVLPYRKDHLILLVGYEHERASLLIERYDPNMISLGYGKSKSVTNEHLQDANIHFRKLAEENIAAKYGVKDNFEFSCNDPESARDEILKCIQKTPDYNHIIAPMNTKISTIGAALAATVNPEIQLCFAQPAYYNYKSYSLPGSTCYLMNFQDLFNIQNEQKNSV